MTRPLSSVQPPSLGGTLVQYRDRIFNVEAPGPGAWVYVTPVTPATIPDDYLPGDPLSVPFEGSWLNNTGGQPCSFRVHPATRVALRGDPVGGAIPSVIFILPSRFRPALPVPLVFGSQDGSAVFTGRVDPTGEVWVLAQTVAT